MKVIERCQQVPKSPVLWGSIPPPGHGPRLHQKHEGIGTFGLKGFTSILALLTSIHLFLVSILVLKVNWTHFYHKAESSLSPHGTGEPSDCTMLWTQHERRLCSTGIRASLKIFDRSGCGTFTWCRPPWCGPLVWKTTAGAIFLSASHAIVLRLLLDCWTKVQEAGSKEEDGGAGLRILLQQAKLHTVVVQCRRLHKTWLWCLMRYDDSVTQETSQDTMHH